MKKIDIIGVEISVTNMHSSIEEVKQNFEIARGGYICVGNVHTSVMASEDEKYCEIQNNSFMTLPDGKPLSIIGRYRGYKEMDRVTGPEFMEEIFKISDIEKWNHFFYGNSNENIKILVEYLKTHYPSLRIVGFEPSIFKPLSKEEENSLIDRINRSKADFVWIGMGAPIQEQFCAKLSHKTNSIWVGVGGAFNVVAGIIPRAPEWMQKSSLEWFYRLMKEPKRLFKRYLITNTKFLFYLAKHKGK